MVEVPLPEEVVELTKVRGIEFEKLVEAAEKLLILEIVAMDSKLSIDDAIELGKEVTRKVSGSIQYKHCDSFSDKE